MTKGRKVSGLQRDGYQANDYFIVGRMRWVFTDGGTFLISGGYEATLRAVWDVAPAGISPCFGGWHDHVYRITLLNPRAVVLSVIRKALTERVRETREVAAQLKQCRQDQMRLRNFLKHNPLK